MATSLSIVLVEDHVALRRSTAEVLRQGGHLVTELSCAEDIGDATTARQVDLFIIDVGLPGEDGLTLAHHLRAVHPQVGIIITTARSQPKDVVDGFRNGADQFLVKPVEPSILLGAVDALGRRVRPILYGADAGLRVDTVLMMVRGSSGETLLSAVEMDLLTSLARASGQRLELFQVSEIMRQPEDGFNKASVEVRVARLRKKLIGVGAPANCIKAIRQEGYQLCVEVRIY